MEKRSLLLVNAVLFLSVSCALFANNWLIYLFSAFGLILNISLMLSNFSSNDNTKSTNPTNAPEPNLTEKNLIMEDLDREVTRRRESEQLSKN